MAYQVLARKCRPQDFSSLIGQEPIVTSLRNALGDKRVAQAYIFSGIRGVGKTSAARILAKALNCEKGPRPEPCNECGICQEITRGGDLDVIEVDAATYSKVEQVRELTESLKYGPARDRYKVVILDEVHRLSRQAFDALLKIIEEPPAHLVFIFATTELEAVPATILSRCQELRFRRVPLAILTAHLAKICEEEQIEASATTLRLIARSGEGSVRDSVALLDQLATFGGGKVADEEALRLLGGMDTALFQKLLAAVLDGSPPGVVEVVRLLEDEGRDPRHAFSQFLSYCRDGLHLALGGDQEQVELPAEEAEALAEKVRHSGYENLLRLVHQLLASEASVRRSEMGHLALEIAWLRAAELPKLTRVEDLLRGGPPPSSRSGPGGGGPRNPSPAAGGSGARTEPAGPSSQRPPAERSHAEGSRSEAPRHAPPPPAEARPPSIPAEPSVPSPAPEPSKPPRPRTQSPAATGDPRDPIRLFLEEVKQHKNSLAAHLEETENLSFRDGQLIITLHTNDRVLEKALGRDTNREVIDAAVARAWGEGSRWRHGTGSSEKPQKKSKPAAEAPRSAPIPADPSHHPTQQTVLSLFDGTVETIEERKGNLS